MAATKIWIFRNTSKVNIVEIYKKNALIYESTALRLVTLWFSVIPYIHMYKGLFSFFVSVPWAFEWSQGEHPAKIGLFGSPLECSMALYHMVCSV